MSDIVFAAIAIGCGLALLGGIAVSIPAVEWFERRILKLPQ